MFWDNFVINLLKSPNFVVAEHEAIKSQKGLSANIL